MQHFPPSLLKLVFLERSNAAEELVVDRPILFGGIFDSSKLNGAEIIDSTPI